MHAEFDLQPDITQLHIDFVNAFAKVCFATGRFCKKQNAKCEMRNAKCEMRNAKAKCKMQTSKCSCSCNSRFSDVLIFTNYFFLFWPRFVSLSQSKTHIV